MKGEVGSTVQLQSRARLNATRRGVCDSEETEGVMWGVLAGGEGVQVPL